MNRFEVFLDSDKDDYDSEKEEEEYEHESMQSKSKSIEDHTFQSSLPTNHHTLIEIPQMNDRNGDITSSRQEGGMVNTRVLSQDVKVVDTDRKLSIDLGFSEQQLTICCQVIERIGQNIDLLKLPSLRSLRIALNPLIQDQLRRYRESNDRDESRNQHQYQKRKKRRRIDDHDNSSGGDGHYYDSVPKLSKQEELEKLDRAYINKTQLRVARLMELEKLNESQSELCPVYIPRIPDGYVRDIPSNKTITNEINGTSKDSDFIDDLNSPLSCYICHKPFTKLHFFYSHLCPDCAIFNYMKRNEMTDLTNYISLVTGGRTKIGYCTALKLLRCGSTVLVTTRFPMDCLSRYRKESDWNVWSSRLHIYSLDFRLISSVEQFCCYLNKTYPYLDIIINNAAQTVRRPASYYHHLLPTERISLNERNPNLDGNNQFWQVLSSKHPMLLSSSSFSSSSSLVSMSHPSILNQDSSSSSQDPSISQNQNDSRSLLRPHEMSQMIVLSTEDTSIANLPVGAMDVNGQQVDLRKHNSWTMKLHEVSTQELAEVFAINVLAPTVINSKLKSMLERSPHKYKFIVNVSAMEGKFYRFKTDKHPHTNMAKAALNMQTRTSAQDYVKSGIYMTCVDTGWINDEKPIDLALHHQQKDNFQTPIDEVDAASRVLDPIIAPLRVAKEVNGNVEPPFGVFLKDYMKSEW